MTEFIAALLAALVTATGIPREPVPELMAIAERRVVEIQSNFSHEGRALRGAEVIHTQQWIGDPSDAQAIAAAVDGWRNSPPHWAGLTDQRFTQIGCAVAETASQAFYFVCILGSPQPSERTRGRTPTLLPNTSTLAG